jgi:peptide/nickel transport system ATP-binding protein
MDNDPPATAASPRTTRARLAPLLEVDGLSIGFGDVTVVEDVSFSVAAGEVVGIVGESGSGKSVTALALLRLVPRPGRIVAGSIRLGGEDLRAASEARLESMRGTDIAMIFQEPMTALNPVLSVGSQIVETIRRHQGIGRKAARARALDMLSRVGIPAPGQRIDEYPHQLSGGMRQRVMIAMALACNPKLLIADEPTTALDVTIQAQILELLQDLQAEFRMSVLLITHDLGVVSSFADRVMVMYAGRIVEESPADALFERPVHPYTRGLIDSIPSAGGDTERLKAIPGVVPPPFAWPPGCRFAPRCGHAVAACTAVAPALRRFEGGRSAACILVPETGSSS